MAYAKRRVTMTAASATPGCTSTRLRAFGWHLRLEASGRTRRARRRNAMIEVKWIEPTDGKITFRRYVEEQWWASRHLELHSKAAYRFHDLRHAHASWALAGGADLKAVMDRLGHAQITTTQRYLHTLPESDDQALIAFSRIRNRTGNPQTRRAG